MQIKITPETVKLKRLMMPNTGEDVELIKSHSHGWPRPFH
jgi:hypothetical protein